MSQSTNYCLRTTKCAVLRAHAPSRAPVVEQGLYEYVGQPLVDAVDWTNPGRRDASEEPWFVRILLVPGASSKSTLFVICTCVLRHKLTALQVCTCDHLQTAEKISQRVLSSVIQLYTRPCVVLD